MQDDPQTNPGFKLPDGTRATAAPNGAADRGAKTMTKAELAEALFDRARTQQAGSQGHGRWLSSTRSGRRWSGASRVKLSGFGNFQLRDKPQRPGRNPKTGEEIAITARRVVTFHASQKLKAAVARATGVN